MPVTTVDARDRDSACAAASYDSTQIQRQPTDRPTAFIPVLCSREALTAAIALTFRRRTASGLSPDPFKSPKPAQTKSLWPEQKVVMHRCTSFVSSLVARDVTTTRPTSRCERVPLRQSIATTHRTIWAALMLSALMLCALMPAAPTVV